MQFRQQNLIPTTLLLLCSQLVKSSPLISDTDRELLNLLNRTNLIGRGCDNPCGWNDQVCCGAGAVCYTDTNSWAQCSTPTGVATAVSAASTGYWLLYTTTYVETDLVTATSVYSSYVGYVPATKTISATSETSTETASAVTCDWDSDETSCGNICCSSGQYCLVSGQCAASGTTTTTTASSGTYSVPLRVTSSTLATIVTTVPATTTVSFESAVATGATLTQNAAASSGLSGGAIAGIVIGVILGIILLLTLCIFCCFRAAWDGVKAFFGIGSSRRRRRETTEVEEYRRHGSRSDNRRWYGDRPARPSRTNNRKNDSGLGNWGWIAAGLAGVWAVLGLSGSNKKNNSRRRTDEKSDYTASSGYYSSDYTSSSDRRTRDTRRSSRR